MIEYPDHHPKPTIALLQSVDPKTGLAKLCPRWRRALTDVGLDVFEVNPFETDPVKLSRVEGVFFTGGDINISPEHYNPGKHGLRIFEAGTAPEWAFASDEAIIVSNAHYRMMEHLTDYAAKNSLPVLATCLGMQGLNVIHGGTLKRVQGHDRGYLQKDWEAVAHTIYVPPKSKLASTWRQSGWFEQNSIHRWAIDELASGFDVDAYAFDGCVEAVSSTDGRLRATQFHPETSKAQHLNGLILEEFARSAFIRSIIGPLNAANSSMGTSAHDVLHHVR